MLGELNLPGDSSLITVVEPFLTKAPHQGSEHRQGFGTFPIGRSPHLEHQIVLGLVPTNNRHSPDDYPNQWQLEDVFRLPPFDLFSV